MIDAEDLAAARVFGRPDPHAESMVIHFMLDRGVADAWRHGRRGSRAWSSIRTAVRRFARQVLVSSAFPAVVIRDGGTWLETVTAISHDQDPT